MAPVDMSAIFWVKDNDSAGRAKSETPVRTMAHYITSMLV
jgi:hypothetical protein